MSITQRFAMLITADASTATPQLNQVATATAKVEVAEARLAVAQAKAAGSADLLAASQKRLAESQNKLAVNKAEGNLAGAQKDLAGLEQQATGAAGGFQKLLGAVTPTGAALGGLAADAAAFKFGQHLVSEFADATAGVRAFQRVSGATAEDSSKLTVAARVLGVDSEQLGKSMFRLAHNLDGGKDALAKYGVEVAKNKDGSADLTDTMLNVADAVHRVGPGAEADAIAFAAFGRQGAALLPILLRGRDGLKEITDNIPKGEMFNQADLEKGRQFTLATKQLSEELRGLEIEGGKALVPLATAFVQDLKPAVSFFGTIARGIEDIHSLNRFVPSFLGGDAGKKAADSQKDLTGAASAAATSLDGETTAATDAAKAVDDLKKATTDAMKAQDSLDKAHRSVTTAQRGESQARDDLNKLQQQGAVDANAVAQAEKGVASAAKATSDAQKAEAQAAQRVADAQQGVLDAETELEKVRQGASPEDIAKAQLAASKAKRDHERSTIDLADAQDKQNTIVTTGIVAAGQQVGTARDQERAALDLADATEAVQASDFAAKDAQEALTKIQQQGKDGSDDLKKAQADLKKAQDDLNGSIQAQADAHQAVIDKQQAEVEAGGALNKARAGDPDFAEKLRDAQQKVADAHQNTVDQINAEKDALDALNQAEATLAVDRGKRADIAAKSLTDANSDNGFAAARGGLAGPGNAPTTVTNTSVVVHTGADPHTVVSAINTHAAANGGKPR
jgi:hypothetical protein